MNDKLKTWLAAGAGIVVGILFVFACFPRTVQVVQPGEVKVVGTGSIFGRQDTQKADVGFIQGTSSTPVSVSLLAALQNSDADNTDRITREVDVYMEDTSSTWAGNTYRLYVASSTSATATSTNYYGFVNGVTITTSTQAKDLIASSTFTNAPDRRLKANEYLLFIVLPSVSSTGGYAKQVYDKSPTQGKY